MQIYIKDTKSKLTRESTNVLNDRCIFSVSDRSKRTLNKSRNYAELYLSLNIMKMVENSSFIYLPILKHHITFLLQIPLIAIQILAVSGCLSHDLA